MTLDRRSHRANCGCVCTHDGKNWSDNGPRCDALETLLERHRRSQKGSDCALWMEHIRQAIREAYQAGRKEMKGDG